VAQQRSPCSCLGMQRGLRFFDSKNRVVPSQVLTADEKTHTFRILVHPESVPSMGYEVFPCGGREEKFSLRI